MGRLAVFLWLFVVSVVAACSGGAPPAGTSAAHNSPGTLNTAPALATGAERPLSEWVTPENQHLVLADMANGQVAGPGDLFGSPEAYAAFTSQVAGKKGWEFLKLSAQNARQYRVLRSGKPQGFLVIDSGRDDSGPPPGPHHRIWRIEWWNERAGINRRSSMTSRSGPMS